MEICATQMSFLYDSLAARGWYVAVSLTNWLIGKNIVIVVNTFIYIYFHTFS